MSLVNDIAKYIGIMEGWHPGLPSWINNNPGNLDDGPLAIGKDANGRARYASVADGWTDLYGLLLKVITKHPEITMEQLFCGQRDAAGNVIPGGYDGFAPTKDPRGKNDPLAYARFVAAGLGISPTQPLGQIAQIAQMILPMT